MKYLIPFLLLPFFSYAQKSGDSKIIVSVNDTAEIYQKIKYALVNSGFQVKDNGNIDTLTTYSMPYKGIYCVAQAIINRNTITLAGGYGLKKIDDFGYTNEPTRYNSIIFYKGSRSWKLLSEVANRIGNQISYSQ